MASIKKILELSVLCFSLLLVVAVPAYTVEYEYTELLPPGWSRASATDINDDGVVVGFGCLGTCDQVENQRGFIYNNGKYTELLPPGCAFAIAMGINNRGEVVGEGYVSYVVDSKDDHRGFIYKDGIYTEVNPPWSNLGVSSILGITNNGEVVGTLMAWSPLLFYDRGFIYEQGVYRKFIRKPLWMIGSPDCKSINNNCAVVGEGFIFFWPYSPLNTRWGFIYRGGIYTWLLPPGSWYSNAYGINDQGAVVGSTGNPYSQVFKGFIYQYGRYTWLLPPGWISAEAFAINNKGTVVGRGADGTDKIKFFVYSNGTYTELLPPCLGVGYPQYIAINNNGAVVVTLYEPDNCTTAFIAVPKSN